MAKPSQEPWVSAKVAVTQPWGGSGGGDVVKTYSNDVHDQLVEVIGGEGNVTGYVYSDRDLLTAETSEVSGLTDYAYNKHGELVSQTDQRGITTVRTLDELDRVTLVAYPPACDEGAVQGDGERLTRPP